MNANIYTIHLDVGLQASLDFQEQRALAVQAVQKGCTLHFEIDLGLFSNLKKPLSNSSQYLSLKLSLEHFKKTLWLEFEKEIGQVCLYRGNVNFSENFFKEESFTSYLQEWVLDCFEMQDFDPEIFFNETGLKMTSLSEINPSLLAAAPQGKRLFPYFCRDVALDYLHLLRADLPDSMPLCIKLDVNEIHDPVELALLTQRDFYDPFNLFLNKSEANKYTNTAICLPTSKKILMPHYLELKNVFDYLIKNQIPYRLIPESWLLNELEGVDFLYVAPSTLTLQTRRKLQGFTAAGGTVISLLSLES